MRSGVLFAETCLRRMYRRANEFWRDNSPAGRDTFRKRAATDKMLFELAERSPNKFNGNILVDATFDNPNYWLRFSLLRAALGFHKGREIGLLGEFRRAQSSASLQNLGIERIESYPDLPVSSDIRGQANALLESTKSPEDILSWKLPDGVAPAIIYDGILKRQRRAAIDLSHPNFVRTVHEALASIEQGRRLLDKYQFDLLVVSHPFNFVPGVLAWQGLSRGIEAVMPFGLFGALRFARFRKPEDLFAFYDRPVRTEIDNLDSAKAEELAAIGRQYLAGRLAGRADDLASVYAFQRNTASIDRTTLCEMHGWNPETPIVTFYASNWFDWPHQLGMTQFRDFLDWTEATFGAAVDNRGVNWLFKPHPAEERFGGVSLSNLLQQFGSAPNIAISDERWNNAAVMRSVDALVSYHGTAGIEFAAQGKPVLVPDRGKYDDCGFVKVAANRADYLALLRTQWWTDINLEDTKRRAEIFAGWWFCVPGWQEDFVLQDDARQDALYSSIPGLLSENPSVIEREIKEITEWWQTDHPYYHTVKMQHASTYKISNLT